MVKEITIVSFPASVGQHKPPPFKVGNVRRVDQFGPNIRVFMEITDAMANPPESCTFTVLKVGKNTLNNLGACIGSVSGLIVYGSCWLATN